MLDGPTTVLEAARALVSLAHTDAIAELEGRKFIIGIESETDHLPVGGGQRVKSGFFINSLTEPTEITDAGVNRGVESNLMRFPIAAVTLLATTFVVGMPQSPFVGKWQTRISRVTKKSAITVNIAQGQQKLGGTVVLVNPDASEIELPILNVKVTDKVIEFETHLKNDTFYWSLTVQKNQNRGLLHGSCREMLVDERVQKQH